MKVKIGDKIYYPTQEPIMIILSEYDKENISKMDVKALKYAAFPENTYWDSEEKCLEWMEVNK